MALIGRQPSSGAFLKLDDIASQFDGSTTTFNLTLGGVIQEPIAAFTITESQINFASAPMAGADFFIVVLATTNVDPLRSLTIGRRAGAHNIDLHGRAFAVKDRAGNTHSIAFNLA